MTTSSHRSSDEDVQDYLDGTREHPPDADPQQLAAYRLLYDALKAEPDGALPPGFAESVARRALPTQTTASSEGFAWVEHVALPLLLVAGFAAGLLFLPELRLAEAFRPALAAVRVLWEQMHLEPAGAAGLILLAIGLLDAFLGRERASRPALHH